jgi:hypothetical protein
MPKNANNGLISALAPRDVNANTNYASLTDAARLAQINNSGHFPENKSPVIQILTLA